MAQKEIRPVVGYEVDRASEQAVIQSTERVEAALSGIGGEAAEGVQLAERATSGLNAELSEEALLVRRLVEEWEAVEGAARRANDEQGSGAAGSGIETGRGAVGDLSTTFGAAASALGGNQALAGAGDLLGLIEYAPVAVAALGALNPAILGIGVAVGGVVGLIGLFNAGLEESKRQLQLFIDGLTQGLEAGTTPEIQARIDEQQAAIDRAQQVIDYLESQSQNARSQTVTSLNTAADDITDFLNNAGAALFGGEAPAPLPNQPIGADAYTAAIEEQRTAIEEARANIEGLTFSLGLESTAANDAAAASAAAAQEQIADVERRRALETEARTMTADTLQARLDGIRADMAAADRARQALLNAGEQTAAVTAQINAYTDEIGDLYEDEQLLLNVLQPVIQAREDEATAAGRLAEAQARLTQTGDAVLAANERLVAAEANVAQMRTEDAEKFQEHQDKLRAIADDSAAKEAEARAAAGEARAKAEEDRREQEAAIAARYNAGQLSGAEQREASILLQTQRAQEKEAADLETATKKRQKEIDDDERKRLEAIQKAADQTERIERERFARENAIRAQAAGQALADLQNASQYTRYVRVQYFQAEIIQEIQHQASLQGIVADGQQVIEDAFSGWMGRLAGIVFTGMQGTQLPVFSSASRSPVAINVAAGISKQGIRDIAISELDQALSDAGYE